MPATDRITSECLNEAGLDNPHSIRTISHYFASPFQFAAVDDGPEDANRPGRVCEIPPHPDALKPTIVLVLLSTDGHAARQCSGADVIIKLLQRAKRVYIECDRRHLASLEL